jgi:hypothetical protein
MLGGRYNEIMEHSLLAEKGKKRVFEGREKSVGVKVGATLWLLPVVPKRASTSNPQIHDVLSTANKGE